MNRILSCFTRLAALGGLAIALVFGGLAVGGCATTGSSVMGEDFQCPAGYHIKSVRHYKEGGGVVMCTPDDKRSGLENVEAPILH